MTASEEPSPKPSSDNTPYCLARSSPASGASNSQSSRSVTSASLRDAGSRAREPDGTRISRGARRAINGSRSARVVSINRTSPVETSAAATPTRASDVGASRSAAARIAQMKLFRVPSSKSSASATPGLTVSMTSRRTTPFANFGSSVCSQMATRNPCCTSRRT